MCKIVSAQCFKPCAAPFSCSCVGSQCSMACSIAQSWRGKNAHIWPFYSFLMYANVSIIVLSCADLGPFRGLPGCPMISPGWYFFSRRPPHVSPHSPIFGQNLIDGCVPYADNSHASHKNGSIFGFNLITSIIHSRTEKTDFRRHFEPCGNSGTGRGFGRGCRNFQCRDFLTWNFLRAENPWGDSV